MRRDGHDPVPSGISSCFSPSRSHFSAMAAAIAAAAGAGFTAPEGDLGVAGVAPMEAAWRGMESRENAGCMVGETPVSPCFTINLSGINRINIWFSRDTILYLYDVISNLNSAKLRVCLFWAIPDFQMTRSIGIGLSYFQINQTNKTGWWFQTWRLFPIIHGIILPIDELIFFRGVGQPPTRKAKHIIILLRMIPTTKK